MAENKTQPTDADPHAFLDAITDPVRRADAQAVCLLMTEISGEPPVMWGSSIVGFGFRHLRYATGRELDWMLIGLSPRKQNLTLYLDSLDARADLLARLGPHTTAKSCLYLKRLDAVDPDVLRQVVALCLADARATDEG